MEFVYKNVTKVDNILLVIDHSWLSYTEHATSIQSRNPWQMRPSKDYFDFQKAAIKYFFSINVLKDYIHIGKDKEFRLPAYMDERGEPHSIGAEWALECAPEYYFATFHREPRSKYDLYKRDSIEHIGEPVITEKGVELLSQIHQLFVNGNTNYKIVVSPLFDQIKLNPIDKSILDSIFDAENVYDYSGINKYTADTLNYYEASHYRPRVAVQILEEIYAH